MTRNQLKAYTHAAEKALDWLNQQLQSDGSYGPQIDDLACYYKSPYLFQLCGRLPEAERLLNHIQQRFMQANGDFLTAPDLKSENGAFVEYWAYTNAWIAQAAQKIGCFQVAFPAYQYLQAFYCPVQGGFATNHPCTANAPEPVQDVLTTAHLGLTALYFGDLDKARTAGNLLQNIIRLQPHPNDTFYLRIDSNGDPIATFPEESAIFFQVSATAPNQAYFMIGYPIAFLGKLYDATHESQYLETAKQYCTFASRCHDSLFRFHFSHKVAWGAAILARLTQEQHYADVSQKIADFLLSIQAENGAWLTDRPAHTCFDQTAEIALWLKTISSELSAL